LQGRKNIPIFAAVNHNKRKVKGSSITAGILFLLRCEKMTGVDKMAPKLKRKQ
jgi:hypothetical protein